MLLSVIGAALNKMESEKGIVTRFVIGRRCSHTRFFFPFLFFSLVDFSVLVKLDFFFIRSENHGDSLDLEIDIENRQNNDFIVLVCI